MYVHLPCPSSPAHVSHSPQTAQADTPMNERRDTLSRLLSLEEGTSPALLRTALGAVAAVQRMSTACISPTDCGSRTCLADIVGLQIPDHRRHWLIGRPV